jgi:large subunit ribosomal protein L13
MLGVKRRNAFGRRRETTNLGFAGLRHALASDILSSLSFHFYAYSAQGFPMNTISANAETVKRDWFIVDASNKTLGRLATELARRLRGKHKPVYTPHCDTGDYLVVVNAEKIAVTGKKMDDKIYHHVTGYIGNIKSIALKDLLKQHPERVIEIAVKGMLPKNPLGRAMYRKLKVYAGPDHPHSAQQPQALDI